MYKSEIKIKQIKPNFNCSSHRQAFANIYKTTNIIKLRNFQYRLLHNKIFCNNILYHWKIKNSQNCDYCEHKQDIVHLLFDCIVTKRFWNNLIVCINKILKDKNEIRLLEWKLENIIYNKVHPRANHVINFIILAAKFHIFRAKCNIEEPNYLEFKYEIILLYKIEKYNANKSNRIGKNNEKWDKIDTKQLSI